uniref:Uncharacterized protein n=1 Tax=Ciona intestinalis TaxID=7719 RepID=H2Y086_CIOIN
MLKLEIGIILNTRIYNRKLSLFYFFVYLQSM